MAFLLLEDGLTLIKEKKAEALEFLFLFYLFFLQGEQPLKNDKIWHSLASDYTDTNIWGGATRRSLSSLQSIPVSGLDTSQAQVLQKLEDMITEPFQ